MASPTISHLILNTANYEAMKQWYLDVFEAKIGVETSDHSACFLQMDESHHRIGMGIEFLDVEAPFDQMLFETARAEGA